MGVAEQGEVDFQNGSSDEEEAGTPEDDEDEQEEVMSAEYDEDDSDSDDVGEEDSESAEEEGEEDEDQTEEYDEYVRKSEVKAKIDGPISDVWFRHSGAEVLFNFEKLDRVGIPSYEPPKDGITYEHVQK